MTTNGTWRNFQKYVIPSPLTFIFLHFPITIIIRVVLCACDTSYAQLAIDE